jgi:putative ABC transport system permease protein
MIDSAPHCAQASWKWAMPIRTERAIREAARNATAHRATTIMLILVTMAMTTATFITAGRAAAAEEAVLHSVDNAGPRLIEVTIAEPSPGVDASTLERFKHIDAVERVLGLGPARDVRSSVTGARVNVAARDLLSPLPPEVTINPGRSPRPGEAIIGADTQQRLQLIYPSGALLDSGTSRAVVGAFSASGAITDLDRLVLIQPEATSAPSRATLVYLLADQAENVAGMVREVRALAAVSPVDSLVIRTAPELVELAAVLSGEIGGLSRQLALGAILVGVVLVALTMTLALSTRRRDFGRRRALGASRSALIALTLLEAAFPVVIGVIVGTIVGLTAVILWMGAAPPIGFIVAADLLIALAGTAAAIPPAALAAAQDPVRILRVP